MHESHKLVFVAYAQISLINAHVEYPEGLKVYCWSRLEFNNWSMLEVYCWSRLDVY